MRKQRVILEDDDGTPTLRWDFVYPTALDSDLAAVRSRESGDQAKQCCLPATARSEQCRDPTLRRRESYVRNSLQHAKSLTEALELNIPVIH
jgi:hypothetical protein